MTYVGHPIRRSSEGDAMRSRRQREYFRNHLHCLSTYPYLEKKILRTVHETGPEFNKSILLKEERGTGCTPGCSEECNIQPDKGRSGPPCRRIVPFWLVGCCEGCYQNQHQGHPAAPNDQQWTTPHSVNRGNGWQRRDDEYN